MFDVQRIACDLFRALRGKRSQPAFSRQLGYRSNVAYAWEHGRRFPEVSVFLRAALVTGRDTRSELAAFFDLPNEAFGGRRAYSPRTVMRLVQTLVGTASKSGLAAQLGIDRTTMGRWCGGRTEPRLPEFLSLLQLSTQRLLQFVALFADPSRLPSTRSLHAHFERQRRLAYESPLSHAVLRALELRAYQALPRHSSAFLARQLGVEESEIDRYLEELEAAGQAVRERGHYKTAQILTIDTREDAERNKRLKSFWAREALSRFVDDRAPEDTLFSFNLFAISEDGFRQIRELHLAYYDQVRGIIEQSSTADRVVLMNLELLPLGERFGDES